MMKHAENKQTHSVPLSSSLDENVSLMKDIFEECDDLVYQFAEIENKKLCFIYFANMVNSQALFDIEQGLLKFETGDEALPALTRNSFSINHATELNDVGSVKEQIVAGQTILFIDQEKHAFMFPSSHSAGREVSEPSTEQTIKGSKESFVENIQTNVMLLRQRIRNPSLKIQQMTLGTQTNTRISVAYMKGVANEGIVQEVVQRLSQIEIDGILDSQSVASLINDTPKSPFPTVLTTERPDRVCGALLDGKIAILIDGTPFVLAVPVGFFDFFKSSEDYYENSFLSSTIRWVRFFGLLVALILPSFYIGLTMYHQDLIQTPFLIRIAASREDLPYPVLVEAIFMLITFELIREAGFRMPRTLGGSTVTILGLLLIGQIAVQGGLIGAVTMIFISLAALVSFILPDYEFHQIIRFCGIFFLVLTGVFGFMGLLVGLLFLLTHLVSLRSFGVPYFSPISPATQAGWKDVFIRAPRWAVNMQSAKFDMSNIYREENRNGPVSSNEKKGDRDEEN